MPTHAQKKSGQSKRWRGRVVIDSKVVATKWFGSGPKQGAEYRSALSWEVETRKALIAQAKTEAGCLTHTVCSPKEMSLIEWATLYLEDCQARQALATFKEKRTAFKRFFAHFTASHSPVSGLTRPAALSFLRAVQAQAGNNSSNVTRKVLAAAWGWSVKFLEGFPQDGNPFASCPKFKPQKQPRYIPSVDDFEGVLAHAEGQDQTMLLAYLHTGARRGELFRVTWQDVDFIQSRICLRTMKTVNGAWREDWLPMTSELRDALLKHRDNRIHKVSSHVFVVSGARHPVNQFEGEGFRDRGHWLKKLCSRAGVEPFGVHAIRHLAASILYAAGHTVSTIQVILRHSSPETTTRYLKSLGLEGVREALESTFVNRASAKVIPLHPDQTERATG